MIASKFLKCITKLFNFNPYHFLPSLKLECKPKLITAQENRGIETEKLYENVDLKNVSKTYNRNVPSCKSDVSMLKGSKLNRPPTCHSVPCCNSKLSNLSGKILDCDKQVSVASITETKSTRSQSTCTTVLKECKSAVYILKQRTHNIPIKPSSAPCRVYSHDEAVRVLCEKAMKTCAAARKIIDFYKYRETNPKDSVRIPKHQIEKKTFDLSNQNGIKPPLSTVKFNNTPCPYCTLPSSIPQNYACPFCSKNVKNCTCIHCPHCKKSRINAPYNKPDRSKTKFFKFDKPLSYPGTGTFNATLPEKIKPLDFNIESETYPICKISKPEKLFSSRSEVKKKRPKSAVDKNRKTKSLSQELKNKPTNKKLQQSHTSDGQLQEPLRKRFEKIPISPEFSEILPNEVGRFPWMSSNANRGKLFAQLNPLITKARNSARERNLNEYMRRVFKSSDRKLKMYGKQKDSPTSLVLKQSKDGRILKKTINSEKKLNSSESSVTLIYSAKGGRPLSANTNVRNYCTKQDGSKPKDVLNDCPNALRKVGKCERMEYDEYYGDCYKNKEYFQYDKYSYFTLEECMKNNRCPQPNSRKKDECCKK